MFSKKLKLTVVFAMLMVSAVFLAGVLFSSEPDLRNYSITKYNLKCGSDLETEYKDGNKNTIVGCHEYKDENTCKNATVTLKITQSKGCTEYAYGYECTEKAEDMGHGNVTCKWVTAEVMEGEETVTKSACSESAFSETTSYVDCDHEEMESGQI